MFNLLPEQEKTALRKEYRRRRLIVYLSLGIAVVCTALLLLAPSYVMGYIKNREASARFRAVAGTSGDELSTSIEKIDQARDLLKLMGSDVASSTPSETILKVVDARPAGIKITLVGWSARGERGMQLQGVATTRDSLRGFIRALEQTKLFKSVSVPVSSFARDADIPFSIDMPLK